MSETAEQRAGPLTPPAGIPPSPTGPWAFLRRGGAAFLRQREATAFVVDGIMLTTSHAEPVSVPGPVQGIGHWIGTFAWSEIVWAVVLVAIFHVVLTRTRWGLHTIATGGNIMGAREAGIHVGRIK